MGAWKDVLAGTHELSFCIGVEKLFSPDAPERTADCSTRATSPASTSGWSRRWTGSASWSAPIQAGDDRTIFMDTTPSGQVAHVEIRTTQAQIAAGGGQEPTIRRLNDKAQYRFQMTTQSVLEDRPVPIADPRHVRPDRDGRRQRCCARRNISRSCRSVKDRAIKIAGVGFSGGMYRQRDAPGLTRGGVRQGLQMAGLGRRTSTSPEVHDATSFC